MLFDSYLDQPSDAGSKKYAVQALFDIYMPKMQKFMLVTFLIVTNSAVEDC
jgi:hypothetical protein